MSIEARHIAALSPSEAAEIASARPARAAEFATGRALLHQLLPEAGPIARTASGAPAWPAGTVGSLAHDSRYAVAATARRDRYFAIGIDLEPDDDDLDGELRQEVLRDDDPILSPVAGFVMKEAAFKAWNVLGGEMVGPLAVRLVIDRARFIAHMPSAPYRVAGFFRAAAGHWLALATIEADGAQLRA